jgi:predicted transcriptional regulator
MPTRKASDKVNQTDTSMLRAMWTQSAARIVTKMRNNEQVDPKDVEKLQRALEGIEGREEVERLNAITKEA